MAYAHSRGVIHRDLKGQNVVLGDFGEVVVLDWGFAKVLGRAEGSAEAAPVVLAEEAGPGHTVPGQVIGTPAYMAPEQAEGRTDRIDRRTDVYGLGAILYELLTGHPPHPGTSIEEAIAHVKANPSPNPRDADKTIPEGLAALCVRAMAREPADRFATAGELAGAVEAWMADEPLAFYRTTIDFFKERLKAKPRERRYLEAIAQNVVSMALVLGGMERHDEARRRLLAAVRLYQRLLAASPSVTRYRTTSPRRGSASTTYSSCWASAWRPTASTARH